ncbi:MAG: hypothetical protein C5B59_13945 [Bacteroidetes bacterium]|nr:MAG: hypothetical protein C5B59_13945 [Bacteroidota bacterium]
MRYLQFISLIVYCCACSSPYKKMQRVQADLSCIQKFKPAFESTLYKTDVQVSGKQLSGLLLFKKMQDSSMRIVFTNEVGVSFFDFEFSSKGKFTVHQIMKQFDKQPVITTLRKDFELILLKHTDTTNGYTLFHDNLKYFAFPQEKGVNYYVTDETCDHLQWMERASEKKAVIVARFFPPLQKIPDSISITHNNFSFTIGLKRLER